MNIGKIMKNTLIRMGVFLCKKVEKSIKEERVEKVSKEIRASAI